MSKPIIKLFYPDPTTTAQQTAIDGAYTVLNAQWDVYEYKEDIGVPKPRPKR